MSNQNYIRKGAMATLLVLAVQLVFASFTSTSSSSSGHSNRNAASSKYSLKTIGTFTSKGLTFNSSFHLKATELSKIPQSGNSFGTGLQFTKGNTTFIYPYKVKLKVPKFKAPTPSSN